MSSYELTEWQAYYAVEQLGESPEERADWRAGIVAATTKNAVVGTWTGKPQRAIPEDFMPFRPDPEPVEEDPEDTFARMSAAFGAINAMTGAG